MEPFRHCFSARHPEKHTAHAAAEGVTLKRVFVSDCEGPLSKNDNAYELTAHFVLDGDKLFTVISRYDDVLADVFKRQGYNAGDTLKLILPFLKAYDVTDGQMQEFSAQNLFLIAGSKETLKYIRGLADAFIVSTSYEHYLRALCECLEFPFENTYCTRLSMDKYALPEEETAKLKAIAKEIAAMQVPAIPAEANALEDFSPKDQETIGRLDEIFWSEIPRMRVGKIFSEVTAVGGEQKADAIRDLTKKRQLPLSSVMYVGDSITDVQAFKLVRDNGGLTVSFNGNNYAVKNAEVSVLSENNVVTAVIADVFLNHEKAAALKMLENWNPETLKNSPVNPAVLNRLFELYSEALPKVQIVTDANMESLSKESSQFRKQVRGEAVGKLG
ncbi:MAG: HAD hydrolase family protein [Candidatus Bathyarchaeota archaeon]|nr:HAD hydrolase family protein [Candidatus Bathyarchaeota archaeon]